MAPHEDDALVEAILRDAPEKVTAAFLGSLERDVHWACQGYGHRMAKTALRTGSVETLRNALLAHAIGTSLCEPDWRDTMVSQAIHHYVAQELGVAPAGLFNEVADRLPDGEITDRMRMFGGRTDVTLRSFGWERVSTADGPDIRWATVATTQDRTGTWRAGCSQQEFQ